MEFGRLTRGDGRFVRHEHLYLGTRTDETIMISSINILGSDAGYFSVEQADFEVGKNDCKSIKVTFANSKNEWARPGIDAFLAFEVVSTTPSTWFHSSSLSSATVQIPLKLGRDSIFVEPPSDGAGDFGGDYQDTGYEGEGSGTSLDNWSDPSGTIHNGSQQSGDVESNGSHRPDFIFAVVSTCLFQYLYHYWMTA
jgi:hypothetical protein